GLRFYLLCATASSQPSFVASESPGSSGVAPMIVLVVPVYNEELIVRRLHQEVVDALLVTGLPWRVIYVDDGSSDQSLKLLLEIQQADARVSVLELSRNWGHQAALTAGLAHADGDAAVLLDGDLQDPPSVIPDLVTAWRKGAQVVIAQRTA